MVLKPALKSSEVASHDDYTVNLYFFGVYWVKKSGLDADIKTISGWEGFSNWWWSDGAIDQSAINLKALIIDK